MSFVSCFFPSYFLFITSGRAISSSFIFLLPCYLLFEFSLSPVRPEKASFHSDSPRVSFFGLQSLSSILLLMLLFETVCWIVLRKQCTFSKLLGETIVALKRSGNNESMFSK